MNPGRHWQSANSRPYMIRPRSREIRLHPNSTVHGGATVEPPVTAERIAPFRQIWSPLQAERIADRRQSRSRRIQKKSFWHGKQICSRGISSQHLIKLSANGVCDMSGLSCEDEDNYDYEHMWSLDKLQQKQELAGARERVDQAHRRLPGSAGGGGA